MSALDRTFNLAACVTVLAATLSYCVADGRPVLAAVCVAAVVAGYIAGSLAPPLVLPRVAVNLLVLAAIVHAGLTVVSGGLAAGNAFVSVLSEFLIFVQLIKLFDRRSPRDDGHLLTLSVFVVIGAVLTNNNLGLGVLLLVYTPAVMWSAMLLQITGGHRAAVADRGARPAQDSAAGMPSHGRSFRRDLRRSAGFAVGSSVVLAAGAFLLTPRDLGKDVLGRFGRVTRGASVGFHDEIRLREGHRLNPDDTTPVMDVRVRGDDGTDLGDQLGALYLRGAVLDTYEPSAGTWLTPAPGPRGGGRGLSERFVPEPGDESEGEPREADAAPSPPPPDTAPITMEADGPMNRRLRYHPVDEHNVEVHVGAAPVSQRRLVWLEISPRRQRPGGYLFTVWRPTRLRVWKERLPPSFGRELVLRRAGPEVGPNEYRVLAALDSVSAADAPRRTAFYDNARVREAALAALGSRGIAAAPEDRDLAANRAAVNVFTAYLRQQCGYTLEITAPEDSEDAIEAFIFCIREGNCQHFASALAAMCQSVGMDARVVAGYLCDEYNRISGEYTVRESQAHAWVEARLEPGRWQTFDPSPPADIARLRRSASGVMARLRHFYEALEFTWINSVVTFDESKRSGILRTSEWGARRAQAAEWLRRQSTDGARVVRQMGEELRSTRGRAALAVLAALAGAWLVIRRGRRRLRDRARRLGLATDLRNPAVARLLGQAQFYDQALSALRRAGVPKPAACPPLAHAAAIAGDAPAISELFRRVADLFYAARFGGRELTAAQVSAAAATVRELRELAAGHVPTVAALPAASSGGRSRGAPS